MPNPAPTSRRARLLLWAGAAAVMLGSVFYQRLTGPAHPKRGAFTLAGATLSYRLSRSEATAPRTSASPCRIPAARQGCWPTGGSAPGTLSRPCP